MKWNAVKLGDICIDGGIQTGPFGSQLHQSDYSDEGTPVVMPVDLIDGGISTERIARVNDDHVQRLSRHMLEPGDVVYARRGDVGRCSRVTQSEAGWLCGTGCLRLRADSNLVDKTFLYYALSNPVVVGWVRNHAIGATMPNLNTTILGDVPLCIPDSLGAQRSISSILMAYDNLIENNRRQIALLEEAAQRLYREWFVDLRYPTGEASADRTSWTQLPLTECANVIRGRSYTSVEIDGDEGVALVNLKNLRSFGGWNDGAEKTYSGAFKEEQRVSAGDIIMGVTDMTKERRLVGHVALVPELEREAIISMDLVKLVPVQVENLYLYAHLRFSGIAENIALLANGTNVLHLKPQILSSVQIPIPSQNLQTDFARRMEPMVSEINICSKRIASAQEARDRLLPKLMSGEIEV